MSDFAPWTFAIRPELFAIEHPLAGCRIKISTVRANTYTNLTFSGEPGGRDTPTLLFPIVILTPAKWFTKSEFRNKSLSHGPGLSATSCKSAICL